jgi:tetratricopeptide (TPR) repeat protein
VAGAALLLLVPLAACGPRGEEGESAPLASESAGSAGESSAAAGVDRAPGAGVVSELDLAMLVERFDLPRPLATALLRSIDASAVDAADRDRIAEELAGRYQDLGAALGSFRSTDTSVEGFKRDALVALDRGDFEAAVAELERAVEVDLRAVQESPDTAAERLVSAAVSRGEIAEIALLQLRYAAAARRFEAALETLPDGSDLVRARYLGELGVAQRLAGAGDEAQLNLEQSLRLRKRHLGNSHPDVASSLSLLGDFYRSREDYAKAEVLYQRAFEIRRRIGAPDSAEFVRARENLIEVFRLQGKDAEAEALASGRGSA